MRTIIHGGVVVRHTGVSTADVAFEDGRIVEVGEGLPRMGAHVVDAADCLVMPGGVDAVTRMTAGADADADESFWAGTMAAAWGGTTCVVENPVCEASGTVESDPVAVFRAVLQRAQGQAGVDYAVHVPIAHAAQGTCMAAVAEMGGVSACLPAAVLGCDATLTAVLRSACGAGLPVVALCENETLIRCLAEALQARCEIEARHYPEARPPLCEEEAVFRMLAFAGVLQVPLHVSPLSTATALAHVQAARRAGVAVTAGTCPQYLLLERDCYEDGAAEGLKYVMAPPLRTRKDATALWEGLKNGTVDLVASDHCAISYARKWELSGGNALRCPAGVPGVETRLPLVFSEGVLKGRLTLPQMVRVVAEAPARLLGLRGKGLLEPGADADVIILDPREERTLTASRLHQGTDYTPFEGMLVRGWPRHVWLRGQQVITAGEFSGHKGCGVLVRRDEGI